MKEQEFKPVLDYWKFTRELRSQMNLVRLLERQFFELDDLCEWSIRNDVTILDQKTGKRVSVVDESLGGQQVDVYYKMMSEVGNLYDMLCAGKNCFGEPSREL